MAAREPWLDSLELVHGDERWSGERLHYNPVVGIGVVSVVGHCADESIQQVQVSHIVGGRSVFLDVLPVSRGSFRLDGLRLFRGYNEVVVCPFDASGRSFGVQVLFKGAIREWVETVVCSVMFALIIKTFVLQPFYIPSESMEDTLVRGDRIMVSRFDYLVGSPARKDVIVFEYPLQRGRYFIKRIIGLPGEKVEILDNQVFVDGRPLSEDYVKFVDRDRRKGKSVSSLDTFRDLPRVREGRYFVMGDNRDRSQDSRSWGTVPDYKVVGRAAFVWFPPSRMRWFR